jgi:RHS repeat-associated protein
MDLILQDDGSETRYLLADGLGSVRSEVVDDAVEAVITYSPHGNLLAQTSSSGTVYGFTGEQYDAAASLLFLRARYYNAVLRVFMSKDAHPGFAYRPSTQHDYLYVNNNPVNKTDPSGLCEEVGDEACWSMAEQAWRAGLGTLGYLGSLSERDLRDRLNSSLPSNEPVSPPSLPTPPTGWPGPVGAPHVHSPLKQYQCVYETFKALPNYRVTEDYPFDDSSWMTKHDLTNWLVNQMNVNAMGPVAATLRESLDSGIDGFVAASAGWIAMVRGGAPWDFKPDIIRNIGESVIVADVWYGFDVPANIHYGYVGRSIGFDRNYLLFGPGVAQIIAGTSDPAWGYWYFDDPKDYTAVQVGMDLFDQFGYVVTAEDLAAAIEPRKSLLNQAVALIPPL